MKSPIPSLVAILALAGMAAPAAADNRQDFRASRDSAAEELDAYINCVPFARELTGISLYGDARSWWDQAEGRYKRGHRPRLGAVMALAPHRTMVRGHVATVTRLVDQRTVLLTHANWSPIGGRRGQVERNVRAVDVSPGNDWSQVRIWYAPAGDLGRSAWPVQGFIYNEGAVKADRPDNARVAQTAARPVRIASAVAPPPQPDSDRPSRSFADAFASLPPANVPATRLASAEPPDDVVGEIIRRYSRN